MFGNMGDMFGKVNEMRRMMAETKERLDETPVYVETGGGMVKVHAVASKRIVKIQINPELFSDPEMVEDLLTSAINKVIEEADEVSQRELSKVSGQLLPGFDPSQLGF